MKAHLIYTFFEGAQQFGLKTIDEKDLVSEEALKNNVIKGVRKLKRDLLCKVSCCLYPEKSDNPELKIPDWYMKANGKLWFNEEKRASYGLD